MPLIIPPKKPPFSMMEMTNYIVITGTKLVLTSRKKDAQQSHNDEKTKEMPKKFWMTYQSDMTEQGRVARVVDF